MDLLDKLVRTGSSYMTMKHRVAIVKRYNMWRHGDLFRRRQQALQHCELPSSVDMDDGYAVDDSMGLPFLSEMLADADAIIAENRSPPPRAKDYLINHLTDDDLIKRASFLNFACSEAMSGIASRYLGLVPVLSTVELWRSGIHTGSDVGSQLLHLDNADDKQVKVFVNLHDIDLNCGPFAFFPADLSRRICESVDYGQVRGVERLTDEQAYAVATPRDLINCTGRKGTVFFVDTISCLHYGSRGNTRPRYVLMCQYLSPCRADFRGQSIARLARDGDASLRKYLLNPDYVGPL